MNISSVQTKRRDAKRILHPIYGMRALVDEARCAKMRIAPRQPILQDVVRAALFIDLSRGEFELSNQALAELRE